MSRVAQLRYNVKQPGNTSQGRHKATGIIVILYNEARQDGQERAGERGQVSTPWGGRIITPINCPETSYEMSLARDLTRCIIYDTVRG